MNTLQSRPEPTTPRPDEGGVPYPFGPEIDDDGHPSTPTSFNEVKQERGKDLLIELKWINIDNLPDDWDIPNDGGPSQDPTPDTKPSS